MGRLDGKVALITGSGSGIGRATALLFANEGAKVSVADYAQAEGQETVRMIKEAKGEALFIKVDVSKSTDVERMVKTTVDAYGRIDILYNNAGIWRGIGNFTAEATEEDWDLILNTNLKGVFLSSKCIIPVMLTQGGGVIINTASAAALLGQPGSCAYGASKAGVVHLTKTMALEYARQNIRVNCICPGGILTPMIKSVIPVDAESQQAVMQVVPLGRVGQPEEIAKAALYLASDDSSYITGASLVVDGGHTVNPAMPG